MNCLEIVGLLTTIGIVTIVSLLLIIIIYNVISCTYGGYKLFKVINQYEKVPFILWQSIKVGFKHWASGDRKEWYMYKGNKIFVNGFRKGKS